MDLEAFVGGGAATGFEPLEAFANHIEFEPVFTGICQRRKLEVEIELFSGLQRLREHSPRKIAVDQVPILIEQ